MDSTKLFRGARPAHGRGPTRQQKIDYLNQEFANLQQAKRRAAKPVQAMGRRPKLRLVTKLWGKAKGRPLHRKFKPKLPNDKAKRIHARRQRSLAEMRKARRARIAAEVKVPV